MSFILDNIDRIIEWCFGGGLIAFVSFVLGAKDERKKHELENEESAITNISKIVDEYQDYIEQLKIDRENAIKERNAAFQERDDYKKQTDDLWKEINELKRKMGVIEGQLAKATLLLLENGITIDDATANS